MNLNIRSKTIANICAKLGFEEADMEYPDVRRAVEWLNRLEPPELADVADWAQTLEGA